MTPTTLPTIETIIYKYGCIWHNGNNYLKMSDVILIASEYSQLTSAPLLAKIKELEEKLSDYDDACKRADKLYESHIVNPLRSEIESLKKERDELKRRLDLYETSRFDKDDDRDEFS